MLQFKNKIFKRTNYYLFLFVLLFFLSCISEVEVSFAPQDEVTTLNCILKTNADTVVAWITNTKIIIAPAFSPIENAEVLFYEENSLVGQFTKSDSTAYVLPFTVTEGQKYKIEVIWKEEVIWAETRIPSQISPEIEAIKNERNSFDYKVLFRDNPKEENYYWIATKGYTWFNGSPYLDISIPLYSNYILADDYNRLVEPAYGYTYLYEYYIRIRDNELPSDSVILQFDPAGINISDGSQEVFVLSVDYHLDKYMKSSLLLEDISWYAEDAPIAYAPFPTYSNVHGGTGIVGSYNSVSKVFTKD